MFGKIALAGLGLGAFYLAVPRSEAVREKGDVFAVFADTAIARLATKRRVVEGTGMGSLSVSSWGAEDADTLLIGVKRAGAGRGAKCRVTVSPASPSGSRAEVDCAQTDTRSGGEREIRVVGERALALVVREHVAATVEGRDYDADRVADGMIGLVVGNAPAIAASLGKER